MGKFLGVDYGKKKIGLALSDEGGKFAFPKEVLRNGKDALKRAGEIISEEGISQIVIGESLDYSGGANEIMGEISEFSEKLRKNFSLPVHFQKEFMTSVEARRYQDNGEPVDASAAALILQRYLDKINT